ncbi:hypothetical protein [Streptomyces sp. A0642]|uniref:hypothetical protein n=1 Tax=Streptomyces sp. A0642 TaxID=2563100 RepID=UPI00144710F4|nr:hypothetical protein [Streptomyces sp. A0642]
MHLNPADQTQTLDDIVTAWKTHERTWTSDACVPEVSFENTPKTEPTLNLGDHKITLDEKAITQLCLFYKIPSAFFGRLTPAEKHFVMNARIDHTGGEVTIAYTRTGITDVRKPSQPRLDVEEFTNVARQLYPLYSTVLNAELTPDHLVLDVLSNHVPIPSKRGLIHGGIRLAQNRKQNLAPTVSPILYHEDTTTTVEIIDPSLKIDARGVALEKVAERLAAEALRADARLTHDVEALDDLTNVTIEGDRITRLHRVAAEHNMPVRPLADITVAMSRTDEPTMFDLVIAIANSANNPKLRDPAKRTTRTRLQTIAGAIVNDHAERCSNCHALVAA